MVRVETGTFGVEVHMPQNSPKSCEEWKRTTMQLCDIGVQIAGYEKVTRIKTEIVHGQYPKVNASCQVKGVIK